MNECERKLLEYRSREDRKAKPYRWEWKRWKLIKLITNRFHVKAQFPNSKNTSPSRPALAEKTIEETDFVSLKSHDTSDELETDADPKSLDNEPFFSINWFKFLLHFIIWSGTFAYAVHIEFGTVYLLLSGFYFMWINTSVGSRRQGELSAYSVFNPDCERIQGTLDAETLEKEMKYGFVI